MITDIKEFNPESIGREDVFLNIDCLEAMKKMPDQCVDLAVVDPPYGDPSGLWHDGERFGGARYKRYREIYAEGLSEGEIGNQNGQLPRRKNMGGGGTGSGDGSTSTRRRALV